MFFLRKVATRQGQDRDKTGTRSIANSGTLARHYLQKMRLKLILPHAAEPNDSDEAEADCARHMGTASGDTSRIHVEVGLPMWNAKPKSYFLVPAVDREPWKPNSRSRLTRLRCGEQPISLSAASRMSRGAFSYGRRQLSSTTCPTYGLKTCIYSLQDPSPCSSFDIPTTRRHHPQPILAVALRHIHIESFVTARGTLAAILVTMANTNPEKLALGTQKAKEFFGEKHAKELRVSGVSPFSSQPAGYVPGDRWLISVVCPQEPDIFQKTAQEFVMEVCFSGYARPGLSFRERSLMNLAMLIALNRGSELKIHLRGAFHNGFTEEQICEACRHAMVYCGVPAGRDALLIASGVAAQLKESGELPK